MDDCSNGTNAKQESNPFEEEEWDEDGGEPLVDNGEPGVPVRALYDYEGAEADELSFKQGTYKVCVFRKISELIDLTWFIHNWYIIFYIWSEKQGYDRLIILTINII